ncbi:hypothetical protein L249_1476 [Ophiocordyceps polyrhachis-furcata BCC 54312]|uniref:Thioredoxin domain-containing protein n=1 Tax=Ophiocordyceps polyrhachis-furcata BCC 54312 TaxID=1330021 RepID=A0A367L4F4_9HYPO|nr:hypothetical protein L249_1476 [Ophiocordyceps polyrhachis-furcata BCC 54312]
MGDDKVNTAEPDSNIDDLPSDEAIRRTEKYVLLDRHGRTHTFLSLYSGHNVARRVLVVFVRHFFCGNCQEFLRSLSDAVTPDALLALPTSTFIVVIGCGDPALIQMYADATGCRFPIYTDPKGSLYDELGMVKTLALGDRPAYMRKSMTKGIVDSIGQALRSVPSGLALKSGDHRQVGGEFLFVPFKDRVGTPTTEEGGEDKEEVEEERKRVSWCHRMRTTRDHAEIAEIIDVLGLGKDAAEEDGSTAA